jgi:acyl-CoA synthetase (NDP forming)
VGTRDLEVPLVAVEELLKWDGVDGVISLGIVGRIELVRLMIESMRRIDKSTSKDFLESMEAFSEQYEENYIFRIAELMEAYEKPVVGVSLARTEEGTVRPVKGKRYTPVFYQTPENAVNVLARMVGYQRYLSQSA